MKTNEELINIAYYLLYYSETINVDDYIRKHYAEYTDKLQYIYNHIKE